MRSARNLRISNDRHSAISGLILTWAALLVSAVCTAQAVTPVSIGPGVAGQIHSLAYDPDDSNVIYAGGDNCGVYISEDGGDSWHLYNRGLTLPNLTRTYYVDDLLVLGDADGVDGSFKGVYAATHGGVFFRQSASGSWVNLTQDRQYGSDYRPYGAPIPFSTLAYDHSSHTLYAGTGNARPGEWNSATNSWTRWPATPDGSADRSYYPSAIEGGGWHPNNMHCLSVPWRLVRQGAYG